MAIRTVEREKESKQEPERVSCFCLPADFGSGRRRTLKGSESDAATVSPSRSSKSSSYHSTLSFFRSKGSDCDSPDSDSASKGHPAYLSSSGVRSKGSDSDSTSSISILSCLRVPETEENDAANGSVPDKMVRWFPYKELELATNCFHQSNLIPHVSFKMYRGTLPSGDVVDVRRLYGVGESRFRTEVQLQSRVEQENLLCLIGFSDDQGEQLLVSEPVGNETLDDHLHGSSGCSLPWNARLRIATGVARAINYLHWKQNPPIIHEDLRPKNIFIGEDFVPKVANYTSPLQYSDLVAVAGSWEYHDPESLSQVQTETCNVFSFGAILLQLITGRPIHDPRTKKSLVHRARKYQQKAHDENFQVVRSLVDPLIADEPVAELEAFWNLALRCVAKDCDCRPTMEEVVETLEDLNKNGEFVGPELG